VPRRTARARLDEPRARGAPSARKEDEFFLLLAPHARSRPRARRAIARTPANDLDRAIALRESAIRRGNWSARPSSGPRARATRRRETSRRATANTERRSIDRSSVRSSVRSSGRTRTTTRERTRSSEDVSPARPAWTAMRWARAGVVWRSRSVEDKSLDARRLCYVWDTEKALKKREKREKCARR